MLHNVAKLLLEDTELIQLFLIIDFATIVNGVCEHITAI